MGRFLNKLVNDSHITVFLGFMFILSGVITASKEFLEKLFDIKVELFHGLIFMGLFNLLMALVFLIFGTRTIEAGAGIGEENGKKPLPSEMEQRIDDLQKRVSILENSIKEKK